MPGGCPRLCCHPSCQCSRAPIHCAWTRIHTGFGLQNQKSHGLDPWESLLFFLQTSLEKQKVFLEWLFQIGSCDSCGALWGTSGLHTPNQPLWHRVQSKQLWKLSKQEKGGRQRDLEAVNHNLLFEMVYLFVRNCSILRAEQQQRRWKLHQRGTHCHGLSWLRLNDLEYTIQITAKS